MVDAGRRASSRFDVEPFRKYCLLNGLDDIGLTLRHADEIRAFEAERLAEQPWLAHTMLERLRRSCSFSTRHDEDRDPAG